MKHLRLFLASLVYMGVLLASAASVNIAAAPAPAAAQSQCPYMGYGTVPTPAQWQYCWGLKQDFNAAAVLGPGIPTPGDFACWVRFAVLTDCGTPGSFTGQVLTQGLTTTQPGFYAQITGDAFARTRLGPNATDVASLAFGSGAAARDTFIERAAAANVRFGGPDAAAPVAQTDSVQNVLAGTSNTAGANRVIAGSKSTGTGCGGSILFQTAPAGSTGSAQNALATALTIDCTKLATFAGAASVASLASTGSITVGTAATGAQGLITNSATGNARFINAQTAGLNRWFYGVSGAAETGSNVGSDFFIDRYADAGGFINNAVSISRATGLVSITSGVSTSTIAASGTITATSATIPIDQLYLSTAPLDQKYSRWSSGSATMIFDFVNDAYSSASAFWTVTRSGISPLAQTWTGTSFAMNGGNLNLGSGLQFGANGVIVNSGGSNIVNFNGAVNGALVLNVPNGTTGASAESRLQLSTGATGASSGISVFDNTASPFEAWVSGSGITFRSYQAPLHRFRSVSGTEWADITSTGLTVFSGPTTSAGGFIAGGSTPTLTGTCTTGSKVGGATAGKFTATCAAQTVIIALPTAPNGWNCTANDNTTPADTLRQTGFTATSCTLTGTTVPGDVITWDAGSGF